MSTETRTVTIIHHDDDTWSIEYPAGGSSDRLPYDYSNGEQARYAYRWNVTRPPKPRDFHGIPEDTVRDIARWEPVGVNDPSTVTIAIHAAREQVARWDAKDECLIRPGDIVTHPDWEGSHCVVQAIADGAAELRALGRTPYSIWFRPADDLTLVERLDR